MQQKRILVAALNWGLGHATRCIPIIRALKEKRFEVYLASDGDALLMFQKEFPELPSYRLPSYNIEYSRKASSLKWKLLSKTPAILKAIKEEKKITEELVEKYHLDGIISDNRFGVRAKKVPSVFITHQLNVLSGSTTFMSSKLHRNYIKNFDKCWVPDFSEEPNLSGKLGHLKNQSLNVAYMGALSRFEKAELPKKYDLLVLLSGPEPQRSLLEDRLLRETENFRGSVLFIRGKMEEKKIESSSENIEIKNYLFGKELETALNASELILCRSGYTSIMDLSKLEKKAFLIPTPGQPEQEYLAQRFEELGIAPYCKQDDFRITEIERASGFSGFRNFGLQNSLGDLLTFFKGE